jgi:hypothetical protein
MGFVITGCANLMILAEIPSYEFLNNHFNPLLSALDQVLGVRRPYLE